MCIYISEHLLCFCWHFGTKSQIFYIHKSPLKTKRNLGKFINSIKMVHTLYIYLFRQLRYHTLRSSLWGFNCFWRQIFTLRFTHHDPRYANMPRKRRKHRRRYWKMSHFKWMYHKPRYLNRIILLKLHTRFLYIFYAFLTLFIFSTFARTNDENYF